jgi:hypothetical protein
MKPDHLEWLPMIWSRLSQAADEVLFQSQTLAPAAGPRELEC